MTFNEIMCNYGTAYTTFWFLKSIEHIIKKLNKKEITRNIKYIIKSWKNKLSLFVWNNAFTIKSNCIKHSWDCNSTLMLKLIKSNYTILPYNIHTFSSVVINSFLINYSSARFSWLIVWCTMKISTHWTY